METESRIHRVPALITQLYQTVRKLNDLYPGRPFTPDGHLVGSIGEVVAAYTYDLQLEKCSNPGFDAKTQDLQTVEIKLTSGDSVSVSSESNPLPKFLVVLKLSETLGFTEVYAGDFPLELWGRKKISKRKIVSLRVNELQKLQPTQALKAVNSLEELNRLFLA